MVKNLVIYTTVEVDDKVYSPLKVQDSISAEVSHLNNSSGR